jgi:predicted dienelactone hydrolase
MRYILTTYICLALLLCASCAAPQTTVTSTAPLTPVYTVSLPQETKPPPALTPTSNPATAIVPTPTFTPQAVNPFPLSEPGPYFVGKATHKFEKEIRPGLRAGITIWYPAIRPEGFTGDVMDDAAPDLSAGPYPLLLSSTEMADTFATHLASHGFIAAGVNNQWTYLTWGPQMLDYPRETLYVLDQLATQTLPGLEGMIDAEHTGYLGYSFDGTNAFFLSGARVDPELYLAECAKKPEDTTLPTWSMEKICVLTENWDEFAAHAGEAATNIQDGLWQPLTDPRIKAVMPMAGEGAWLFGERGLAAIQLPILMIVGSEDELAYVENEYIFERLGSSDKAMITFLGQTHMGMFDPEPLSRWKHFITAFFGHRLQGKEDHAGLYSSDFVAQHEGLSWRVLLDK